MNVRIFAAWALVIVALAAVPLLVHDSFYLGIATHTLVLAILALSLNVLIGHAGMTSLGHAVYLGIPAYACAWLATRAGWSAPATIACAMLLGTATSALFGVLALRASGLGFLMITLALGQVMWGSPIAGWI